MRDYEKYLQAPLRLATDERLTKPWRDKMQEGRNRVQIQDAPARQTAESLCPGTLFTYTSSFSNFIYMKLDTGAIVNLSTGHTYPCSTGPIMPVKAVTIASEDKTIDAQLEVVNAITDLME